MNLTRVIEALEIPPDARLNQRVPKKLLLEQDIPTAADRRQIQDGIDEMIWVAALKPTNIGVPVFRDDEHEYLEIVVITVMFRAAAKPSRLIELIHRTIPYPVILVSGHNETVSVSVAHKRRSQGETGRVVVESIRRTTPLQMEALKSEEESFLSSLRLSSLPGHDLYALYGGYLDRAVALEAARVSGGFALPDSACRAEELRANLDDYTRLARDIAVLRARAEKEKQLNRRVELNLEMKRLEVAMADVRKAL